MQALCELFKEREIVTNVWGWLYWKMHSLYMKGFLAVSILGVFVDPFQVPAHPAVNPREISLSTSILVP